MTEISILVMLVHYSYGGVDYTAEVRDGTGWWRMERFIPTEADAYAWANQVANERKRLCSPPSFDYSSRDQHQFGEE